MYIYIYILKKSESGIRVRKFKILLVGVGHFPYRLCNPVSNNPYIITGLERATYTRKNIAYNSVIYYR